ncbi:hypothetical protein M5K25_024039 [Dendrobium thyrsiflorum]|uniref:Uncharacterized protein n=1 Tax=Dendrobium thyrsiflorum TaxID=117978 RepID=A0ABD0U0W1_DENTH
MSLLKGSRDTMVMETVEGLLEMKREREREGRGCAGEEQSLCSFRLPKVVADVQALMHKFRRNYHAQITRYKKSTDVNSSGVFETVRCLFCKLISPESSRHILQSKTTPSAFTLHLHGLTLTPSLLLSMHYADHNTAFIWLLSRSPHFTLICTVPFTTIVPHPNFSTSLCRLQKQCSTACLRDFSFALR